MSTPSPDLPGPPAAVADDVLVYRLVPVWWCEAIDGQWEFQSGAFDNSTPEYEGAPGDDMSVVLGDTLAELERAPERLPEETLWAGEQWGVAVLAVAFLRHNEEQEIRRNPNEEPAHGEVRGKKNQKRRRRLKAHANWIVRPASPPA